MIIWFFICVGIVIGRCIAVIICCVGVILGLCVGLDRRRVVIIGNGLSFIRRRIGVGVFISESLAVHQFQDS